MKAHFLLLLLFCLFARLSAQTDSLCMSGGYATETMPPDSTAGEACDSLRPDSTGIPGVSTDSIDVETFLKTRMVRYENDENYGEDEIPETRPDINVDSLKKEVIGKIFSFRDRIGTLPDSIVSTSYMRYYVDVRKRSPSMFFVPKMDVFISGKRHQVGESIDRVTFYEGDESKSEVIVNSHTLSASGARNITSMTQNMAPYIYNPTILQSFIFSPFHKSNRRLYRYKLKPVGSWAELTFIPKVLNPQLIKGKALVNPESGQILATTFNCNFRMYKLRFDIEMDDGHTHLSDSSPISVEMLLPKKAHIDSRMRFLWSKIDTRYDITYSPDIEIPDTFHSYQNRELMDKLRPYPLTEREAELYARYDSLHTPEAQDSIYKSEHTGLSMKRIWKEYVQYLFKTQSTDIGNANFRLMPLIDPMFLFHSSTKGFIYRIRTRAVINLGQHFALTFEPTGAYNFRRKRYYYDMPLSWEFSTKHNGRLQLRMMNTDPISNTGIKYQIKHINKNTDVDFDTLSLEYYKNTHLTLDFQYSFRKWNAMNVGINYFRRSALDRTNYSDRRVYATFAPYVEWSQNLWRGGPVATANYEQGIMDVMNGNNSYGKLEYDLSWKIPCSQLRTVSLRLGGGNYFFNEHNQFLDFNKFRDNNLPEKWNDNWTGDFQLIDRRWYNASDYYIRTNATYESPLLALSWLPIVGKHVRMERVYVNTLFVEKFHPYVELGYGFATKAFSFAAYISSINGKYNNIGCKFSLELYTNHY